MTDGIAYRAETFDPASRKLFFLTNEGTEFKRLCTYDLLSGVVMEHESADWDVINTYFSLNGKFRVTGINQDGSIVIRVVRIMENEGGAVEAAVPLPELPEGEIRGVVFSRTGARMAFYVNGDRSPDNLFVHDFNTGFYRQLTAEHE